MSIFVEKFDGVEMRDAVNWIAADADTSRLAITARSQLPDCLIGECSRTRDHTNITRLMNVAWHDPDLASARRNDAGTIRSDQFRFLAMHERFDTHHVHHRSSFRDANDQLKTGIDGFEN